MEGRGGVDRPSAVVGGWSSRPPPTTAQVRCGGRVTITAWIYTGHSDAFLATTKAALQELASRGELPDAMVWTLGRHCE